MIDTPTIGQYLITSKYYEQWPTVDEEHDALYSSTMTQSVGDFLCLLLTGDALPEQPVQHCTLQTSREG